MTAVLYYYVAHDNRAVVSDDGADYSGNDGDNHYYAVMNGDEAEVAVLV